MDRRHLLGLMAAAPVASSLPAGAAALLDPKKPDDLYVIHRKLNHGFDDRVIYWYIRAVRYGLVDSEFTPFWDMHVGFLSIAKDEPDGHSAKTMSSIFYTDRATGKLLETFTNPFTGEKHPIKQPGLVRSSAHHVKTGRTSHRQAQPGMKLTEYLNIGPAWAIGDDVWCRSDGGFRSAPTTDKGTLLQINDWTTFHGSLAEVSNPEVKSAKATQSFMDINTWPAWMNMGGRPGNFVSRGFGRKSWSIDGMPPEWSRFMKDMYPKEFADPRAYIEGA